MRTQRERHLLATDPEYRKQFYKKKYQANKRRLSRNPEARRREKRRDHLRAKYGISPAQYEALYEAQRGRCAICRTEMALLNVDHDHATEEVRGLLCRDCNLGIGRFKDQPERLESAIRYLRFGLTV